MMTSKFLSVCMFTTFINAAALMFWQYSQFFIDVLDETKREMVVFHLIGLIASVIGCLLMAAARSIAIDEANKKNGGWR